MRMLMFPLCYSRLKLLWDLLRRTTWASMGANGCVALRGPTMITAGRWQKRLLCIDTWKSDKTDPWAWPVEKCVNLKADTKVDFCGCETVAKMARVSKLLIGDTESDWEIQSQRSSMRNGLLKHFTKEYLTEREMNSK